MKHSCFNRSNTQFRFLTILSVGIIQWPDAHCIGKWLSKLSYFYISWKLTRARAVGIAFCLWRSFSFNYKFYLTRKKMKYFTNAFLWDVWCSTLGRRLHRYFLWSFVCKCVCCVPIHFPIQLNFALTIWFHPFSGHNILI